MLAELRTSIESLFPRLFFIAKTLDYILTASIDYTAPYREDVLTTAKNYSYQLNYTNASFETRPNFYRSTCLLYANNNWWDNGNLYNDLGKIPSFYADTAPVAVGNHLFDRIACFLMVPYYDSDAVSSSYYPLVDSSYHLIETITNPAPPADPTNNYFSSFFCSSDTEITLKIDPGLGIVGNAAFPETSDGQCYPNYWFNSFPHRFSFPCITSTISGSKYFLFGAGCTCQGINPRDYAHYKVNCVATLLAGGSFSISDPAFSFLGRHEYYRFPSNSRPTEPSSFFNYTDSQTFTGTITYHHYLDDAAWSSQSFLLGRYTKLTDSEAIALMDTHKYPASFVTTGEPEGELNA